MNPSYPLDSYFQAYQTMKDSFGQNPGIVPVYHRAMLELIAQSTTPTSPRDVLTYLSQDQVHLDALADILQLVQLYQFTPSGLPTERGQVPTLAAARIKWDLQHANDETHRVRVALMEHNAELQGQISNLKARFNAVDNKYQQLKVHYLNKKSLLESTDKALTEAIRYRSEMMLNYQKLLANRSKGNNSMNNAESSAVQSPSFGNWV